MKIAELEATIKMYEVQMNMPQNQTDADAMMELTKEYEAAQAQLDEAYESGKPFRSLKTVRAWKI